MQSPQSGNPKIGFLGAVTEEMWKDWVYAFERQLGTLGWTKGSTVEIDYKWAQGDAKNYKKIAKDFVDKKVDVIVTGGTQATLACKTAAAKSSIPVVFATAGDPINSKLVPTFHHPGKVTGVSNQQTNLVIKRLDLLRHLIGKGRIGIIGNDKSPNVKLEMKLAQQIAPTHGLTVTKGVIHKKSDIARVIKKMKDKKVKALLVCTDPLITTHADALNAEAMKAKLPTVHAFREYLDHGGCLSYGPHFPTLFERAADHVDKILRKQAGDSMSKSPVHQPDNFEGVINLEVLEEMGVEVPQSLLEMVKPLNQ
jgi:putative tryptophan/tyrosine transport system substrate-binding protein